MANTTSALKAQRQSIKRAERNKAARSAVRTFFKKATSALADSAPKAAEAVLVAISNLDKAAQKGIIHPNNAARRKSRLTVKLNAIVAAPAVETKAIVPHKPAKRAPARTTTKKSEAAAHASRAVTHTSGAARRASTVRTATQAKKKAAADTEK